MDRDESTPAPHKRARHDDADAAPPTNGHPFAPVVDHWRISQTLRNPMRTHGPAITSVLIDIWTRVFLMTYEELRSYVWSIPHVGVEDGFIFLYGKATKAQLNTDGGPIVVEYGAWSVVGFIIDCLARAGRNAIVTRALTDELFPLDIWSSFFAVSADDPDILRLVPPPLLCAMHNTRAILFEDGGTPLDILILAVKHPSYQRGNACWGLYNYLQKNFEAPTPELASSIGYPQRQLDALETMLTADDARAGSLRSGASLDFPLLAIFKWCTETSQTHKALRILLAHTVLTQSLMTQLEMKFYILLRGVPMSSPIPNTCASPSSARVAESIGRVLVDMLPKASWARHLVNQAGTSRVLQMIARRHHLPELFDMYARAIACHKMAPRAFRGALHAAIRSNNISVVEQMFYADDDDNNNNLYGEIDITRDALRGNLTPLKLMSDLGRAAMLQIVLRSSVEPTLVSSGRLPLAAAEHHSWADALDGAIHIPKGLTRVPTISLLLMHDPPPPIDGVRDLARMIRVFVTDGIWMMRNQERPTKQYKAQLERIPEHDRWTLMFVSTIKRAFDRLCITYCDETQPEDRASAFFDLNKYRRTASAIRDGGCAPHLTSILLETIERILDNPPPPRPIAEII